MGLVDNTIWKHTKSSKLDDVGIKTTSPFVFSHGILTVKIIGTT